MAYQYIMIDQKSYYATVECIARGLDPMKTNLMVADPDRSQNTIRPTVSPSMKALGAKKRCRIKEIPTSIRYITASPQMQLYIDCAVEIHGVFLKYFAPEDIFTYSIDEPFIDVTPYLKMYRMTARELAQKVIKDINDTVGTISTCGIGINHFLAKVTLDIQTKHAPDFIAELDEEKFRETLWDHCPITDFWRIAGGTATRLRNRGLTSMRDITLCPEDLLYDLMGIDAEPLIDRRESTAIADIKAYRSKSKSLSNGQALMRDCKYAEAEIIAKEMVDQLCLDMAAKRLATDSVSLYVGYSYTVGVPGSGGTAKLAMETNASAVIMPAIATLYKRIVNPSYVIRRVCLSCNNVVVDHGVLQLNMFEDMSKQIKNRALQEALLGIRSKYGKNSILRGMSCSEASTVRERNNHIGGHKSGSENSTGTHAQKPKSKTVSGL